MITLTSLSKIYRTDEIETVALENVNLTVDRGEFLSIMGPSGCGKSTLLNIMGLLDAPTTGTVEINGTHTEGMKDKQLAAFRNKTLGFVFQSFHLLNSLNVMDNVEVTRYSIASVSAAVKLQAFGEGGTGKSRIESSYESLSDAAFRWSVSACGHSACNYRSSGDNSGR